MLIVDALVVGTLAAASWRVMRRQRQRKLIHWLTINQQDPFADDYDSRRKLKQIDMQVNTRYRIAVYSLGLTVVGAITYPPMTAISVPFTLFTALPLFERTIENSVTRFEINGDFLGSSALIVSLVVDNYLLASLLQVLLALNEKVLLSISKQQGAYYNPGTARSSISFGELIEALRREMQQPEDVILLDPRYVRPVGDDPA